MWFSVAKRPLLDALALLAFLCAPVPPRLAGSEVSGHIIIQGNAGRKTVAPVFYDLRGASVPDAFSATNRASAFDRVAVWLEATAELAPGPQPITSVRMEQRNRRFEPELLIVPVGSSVKFPNSDAIFHNIFSLSRAQTFDLGYYPQGRSRSVTFPHAGVVQVYCHVHPSMNGSSL